MLDLVTIDGLSATGKTTLARSLSITLGWSYWDTGLLFRAAHLLRMSCSSETLDCLDRLRMSAGISHAPCRVFSSSTELTDLLFAPGLEAGLSVTAADAGIREWVRGYVVANASSSVIVVGRDTATYAWTRPFLSVRLIAEDAVRQARRERQDRADQLVRTSTVAEPHAVAMAAQALDITYGLTIRSDVFDENQTTRIVLGAITGGHHYNQ